MVRALSIMAMVSMITVGGLSGALAMAGETTDVGVIVDYSPPGAMMYLQRSGVKQPVRIATVVQAGDKIELPASSSVTVELADSRRMSSSGPGTWEVPAAPALGSIATFFHRIELIMEPDYRVSASAITRGLKMCKAEPIKVPLLPEGARVKAGERGISLAWSGGCPPYRLELKSEQGSLRVENGLTTPDFRFEHLSLDPGTYFVSITDKAGTNVIVPFLARIDAPAWPDALASDTSHIGAVARALWLADVDHGAWRMDSIELLVPLRRQHDPLAETVSRQILGRLD
jgi:hypothetical protein